jgi:hypothetical protein
MPGQSHFNLFNKDTRSLFMLCIVFMFQLNCALFNIVARYFIIVVRYFIRCSTFVHLLFDFCFHSFRLLFIYSLFIVQKKEIQF